MTYGFLLLVAFLGTISYQHWFVYVKLYYLQLVTMIAYHLHAHIMLLRYVMCNYIWYMGSQNYELIKLLYILSYVCFETNFWKLYCEQSTQNNKFFPFEFFSHFLPPFKLASLPPLKNILLKKIDKKKKDRLSSTIHSAWPTVSPVSREHCIRLTFVLFWEVGWTDARTTCAKTMITTSRDCGSAEWIKKQMKDKRNEV